MSIVQSDSRESHDRTGTGLVAGQALDTLANAVLKVEGISKTFGGLKALNGVTFGVEPGKITALVGPNGAGKTTVFNVITGFVKPDSGSITLAGRPVEHLQPHAIARLGVARTFQTPRVFSYLTVKESLLAAVPNLAGEQVWHALFSLRRKRDEMTRALERCEQVLALADLTNKGDTLGKQLTFGEQRMLSVLQGIISEAGILLVDEPTVGLDSGMQQSLASLLRQAVADGKRGVLLVEHNMEFVVDVAHQIILLVEGQVVLSGDPEEVQSNEIFKRLYLGV